MMKSSIRRYDSPKRIDEILYEAQPYVSDLTSNKGKNPVRRYHIFTIPKKSGGHRVISAPVSELMAIQQDIVSCLERRYKPRECVLGFVRHKSVADNARIHSGRRFVFNADLQDFFPSISMGRVQRALMEDPYYFDYKRACTIARVCCHHTPGSQHLSLPQGAPTSPILSNIVCEGLDRKLTALSREYKCRYTRYADDITFSSNRNVFEQDGLFLTAFYEIVKTEGFRINENKTRLQTGSERQEVTGLTVNRFPNVSKDYLRELRMLIHVYKKYGAKDAFQCYCRAHFGKLSNVDRPVPEILHIIQGKLAYLKMVKGEYDSTYRKLSKELYKDGVRRASGRKFKIQSYTIEEFEKTFNSTIKIEQKLHRLSHRKKSLSYQECLCVWYKDYYAYADIDGKRQYMWFHHIAALFINQNCKEYPDSAFLKNNRFVIDYLCDSDKTYWLISLNHEECRKKYNLLSHLYGDRNYDIDIVKNTGIFEIKINHCEFSNLTPSDLYDILRLRSEVFVVEQNCVYQDLDDIDRISCHCIARNAFGKIVGSCRVFCQELGYAQIGRVVTARVVRGEHVGQRLMEYAINLVNTKYGNVPIYIHAQVQAKCFYEKLGFVTSSTEFLEDGIPHVKMILKPQIHHDH